MTDPHADTEHETTIDASTETNTTGETTVSRRGALAGVTGLGLAGLGILGTATESAHAASTTLEFGGNYTGDPGSNYGLRLDPGNARFGLLGFSDASDGRGVVGRATASSGQTIGVIGRSDSSSDGAAGLMGFNDASSGRTYGFKGRSDSSSGRGALGIATADSGNTIGLEGRADSPDGVAVSGTNTASSGETIGVRGQVGSDRDGATGVKGEATAGSGATYGVLGTGDSPSIQAVVGSASSTGPPSISSGHPAGLWGHTDRSSDDPDVNESYGVYGETDATSGETYGVYGITDSPDGFAVYGNGSSDGYAVYADGRLHVRRTIRETGATNLSRHVATVVNDTFEDGGDVLGLRMTNVSEPSHFTNYVSFLDANNQIGQIEGNGSGGVSYTSASSDVAEYFPAGETDETFEAGDVVGLEAGEVVADPTDADEALVISDAPMVTGNAPTDGDDEELACVALLGQVPVRVGAPVEAGDRLVATLDGVAVPEADRDGPVVGRALEGADAAGDLVAAFVSAGVNRATIEAKDERIETLEAENEQLRDRLSAVEERLESLEAGASVRATGDD